MLDDTPLTPSAVVPSEVGGTVVDITPPLSLKSEADAEAEPAPVVPKVETTKKPKAKPAHPRILNASNEMGSWKWDPNGKHIHDTLIVIGGNNLKFVPELVARGHKVWWRNEVCKSSPTGYPYHVCRETWGYFGYLMDTSKDKPTAANVVFLHGHKNAWHQTGWDSIEDSVKCASRSGRYTALAKVEAQQYYGEYKDYFSWHNNTYLKVSRTNKKYIRMWNQEFGDQRWVEEELLGGWCCSQFTLPQKAILLNKPQFYKRVLDTMIKKGRGDPTIKTGHGNGINGNFMEYVMHLMFGEPAHVDINTEPNCLDTTKNLPPFKHVRNAGIADKALRKKRSALAEENAS